MKDIREQYKGLVLEACRIAVKGGAMTEALEDFIIDNVDRIVNGLSDADFDYLLRNGKVPVREIETDGQYNETLNSLIRGQEALSADLTDEEKARLQLYCNSLTELTEDYKKKEWD